MRNRPVSDDDTWRGIRAIPGVAQTPMSPISPCRCAADDAMCGRWSPASRPADPARPAGQRIWSPAARSPAAITRRSPTSQPASAWRSSADPAQPLHGGRSDPAHGLFRRRSDGVHSAQDAQEAQFLKDNDAILQQRQRSAINPSFNRPDSPGLLDAVIASQSHNTYVNSVLVQIKAVMTRMMWPNRSAAGSD